MTSVGTVPSAGARDARDRAVWSALALLVSLRAAVAFAPGMWMWGLDALRFLESTLAWATWALAAIALAPWVARRFAGHIERAGDAISRPGAGPPLAWAAVLAAWVLCLPDRSLFVGDSIVRQGAAVMSDDFELFFPQAMPLDGWLHHALPRWIHQLAWIDPAGTERLAGALGAGLLGILSCLLVRELGLRGAAAMTALSIAALGGHLGLFTGYGKAFREMALLVVAIGWLGLRALRGRPGLMGMSVAFAVGLLLHRSAIGFLPACVWVWAVQARMATSEARVQRARLASIGVAVLAIATTSSRLVGAMGQFDREHFAPAAAAEGGLRTLLASLADPVRLADGLSLVLMLCPLALLLPFLWPPRAERRSDEACTLFVLLALPFALSILLLHPAQGAFRDWDDFGAAGAGLCLLTARAAGRSLSARPERAGLAPGLIAGALVPVCLGLLLQNDAAATGRRVEAFLMGPPARPAAEHATAREYLGVMALREERWEEAAEQFGRAAEHAPSPRILGQWAVAETLAGRLERARAICRRLIERRPGDLTGWRGLLATSWRLGDTTEARRAAAAVLALAPDDADARYVMRTLR